MFEKIIYISNDGCTIKLNNSADVKNDLMNLHLVFEDSSKKILGEVIDVNDGEVKAKFLGEVKGDTLIGGNIRKPSLDSKIRVIAREEIPLITGTATNGYMELGQSPLYDGVPVYLNVNNFFSNHFAIFGNTGSGKSCGVSRLFQNMFHDPRLNPYKANLFILDSSGEYYNAFSNLNSIDSRYNYRYISTNEIDGLGEKLRLPVYLLNKDDLALLLQCTTHSQLPIIERMLKLALVFSQNDMDAEAYKNHLIAKAIMSILYTNETSPNKRNEIFSILASCSTDEFNLEAPVQGIGYVRKFRECFLIDNTGNFSESVLLTEYVNSFIKEEYDGYEPHGGVFYNLDTLEKALNFTLISEGWLRNEQTYGDSVTLKVRLHSLIVGDNAKYFDVKEYVSLETYLSSLLIQNGRKYQIVNINLSDIDDDFAKVLTKIYSRLIFDFAKGLKNRGSIPFHIILEEAHRYIQSDQDRFLFGYNIFERIAKEGRKYGVILGIITQRPVELSDNVISQCTNFLIFKINHPVDIKYIREMVPHITDEIIEKQKSLQPGTCLGFGLGFKIPLIVKMDMPNPSPLSGNCDVVNIWCGSGVPAVSMPTPSNIVVEAAPKVQEAPAVQEPPAMKTPQHVVETPYVPPTEPKVEEKKEEDVKEETAEGGDKVLDLNVAPKEEKTEEAKEEETGGETVLDLNIAPLPENKKEEVTEEPKEEAKEENGDTVLDLNIAPLPEDKKEETTEEPKEEIKENAPESLPDDSVPIAAEADKPIELTAEPIKDALTPVQADSINPNYKNSDDAGFSAIPEIADVNVDTNGMAVNAKPSVDLTLDDNDDDDNGFE